MKLIFIIILFFIIGASDFIDTKQPVVKSEIKEICWVQTIKGNSSMLHRTKCKS